MEYIDLISRIRAGRYEGLADGAFERDLTEALNLTGNPKASRLFWKAYELGHSAGLEEVAQVACDLADLVR